MKHHILTLIAVGAIAICGTADAQVWSPVGGGSERSAEFVTGGPFPLPKSIAAKGGVVRALLVGGGMGGHSPGSSCTDAAVQGGRGGDGGEVLEVEIPIQPGQCADGLLISVGAGGRGALRAGNGPIGEPGGDTQITCQGGLIARALGGGRHTDASSSARAARGGVGAAIVNGSDSTATTPYEQRNFAIHPAGNGQPGHQGYGGGGGGGGAQLTSTGNAVGQDGVSRRGQTVRVSPRGRGAYGGGSGAGADDFTGQTGVFSAENASQYGGGGGGGSMACFGGSSSREGGHGFSGLVRLRWFE